MIVSGFLVLFAGIFFRLWISNSSFITSLSNRNEVVSPITSWKRVTEGLYLQRNGISPYIGDVFHQTPLMLNFLDYLEKTCGDVLPLVFVALDVFATIAIGYAAYQTGQFMLLLQHKYKPFYHEDAKEKELSSRSFYSAPIYVMAIYLFNPYSITACIYQSTAVFDNIVMALTIIFTLKGWRVVSTFLLALSAYQTFYSIMLVVPIALCIVQRDMLGVVKYTSLTAVRSMLLTCSLTTFWLLSLLYYSKTLVGSWAFLSSTYGFVLAVPELTPNMGIFWYFFTEMFQHFEQFYLIVFQVNVFLYTIPLAIRFRKHPVFLLYTLLVIISIFKSYPSYADIGFYLSLLPCWSFAHKYLRSTFIVTNMFIWCAVLSPIFYHLWIYSGSANANFYFALTLVSSAAQIFYITDLIYAYLRTDFDRYNPKGPENTSNEADNVILK